MHHEDPLGNATLLLTLLVALVAGACAPRAPRTLPEQVVRPADQRPVESPPALRPPVGVTSRVFRDQVHERTLATTIWYPATVDTIEQPIAWDGIFLGSSAWDAPLRPTPRRWPLVLLSHGSGGDGANLAWLAELLASHGYLAAAVDHPGDRFGDSRVEGRFAVWRRPPDVSTVLTQLLADPVLGPRVDPARVVGAGHSSGALTMLALAGARLQPKSFLAYCRGPGAGPDCPFFADIDPTQIPDLAQAGRSFRDRRIRAVVALSPVLGPGVTASSLRQIGVPVTIIASRTDELVPFNRNAARYQRLIPHARLITIPAAGHFVFMPLCSEPGRLVAAQVCVDRIPRIDRAAVHARTGRLIIASFDRSLGIRRSHGLGGNRAPRS